MTADLFARIRDAVPPDAMAGARIWMSSDADATRQCRAARLGGLLVAFSSVLLTSTPASGSQMHWCPGNRFTDALSAAQVRALGCRPADTGRWSQVQPVATAPPVGEEAGEGASPSTAGPATPAPQAPAALPPTASIATGNTGPIAASAPTAARSTPTPPLTPSAAGAPSQSSRDRDARLILEAELQRTLAAQQSLVSPAGVHDPSRLHRLRQDEAALRRELTRMGH